ncbi:hypothetical protein [Streptomyces soliscabiei]|uniref:hypothetical protein n=1 Tax=Streptomyces soliscabiei TaxID=588897 RepID=UPI0029B84214|nr:hypothetical protein [Streptomyces sp. NY05-11A]MDX2683470.1 hypothetical protein [Streptomyces sp. NY05-11A]
MRLPTATLITACALSVALLVVGRGGEGQKEPAPGSEVVAPAVEGRVLLTGGFGAEGDADPGLDRALEPAGPDVPVVPDDIGPQVVPEVPDPPDGGGLIPDGPDESDESDESDVMPG